MISSCASYCHLYSDLDPDESRLNGSTQASNGPPRHGSSSVLWYHFHTFCSYSGLLNKPGLYEIRSYNPVCLSDLGGSGLRSSGKFQLPSPQSFPSEPSTTPGIFPFLLAAPVIRQWSVDAAKCSHLSHPPPSWWGDRPNLLEKRALSTSTQGEEKSPFGLIPGGRSTDRLTIGTIIHFFSWSCN